MAGVTLPPSLITDLRRELGGGVPDIRISIRENEDERFENSMRQINCPHCNFVANTVEEMSQHRWEAHPLLAKRKGHLMTSPKVARKRPNSESSEEGKQADLEDTAPKKKHSPVPVALTSCDCTMVDNCNHSRRTNSADEILKLKQAEEQTQMKAHSLGDLRLSGHFVRTHSRQRSEGRLERGGLLTRSPSSIAALDDKLNREARTTLTERQDTEGTDDLHTLARAAIDAAPITWNGPTSEASRPKAYTSSSPQNWWTYFPDMISSESSHLGSQTSIPQVLISGDSSSQVLGHFLPAPTSFIPIQSHLFANPHFSVSGSFPPGPTYPVHLPFYIRPPADAKPLQLNKLSTLSDVASRYLAKSEESELGNSEGSSNRVVPASKPAVSQPVQVTNLFSRQQEVDQSASVTPHQQSRSQTNLKKSTLCLASQQHHQDRMSVMDDERVRSLEEAMRKIDCCDAHERVNLLPYKCSDGKWRMVESKCVGGAWVVQVPGAVQPSVYLPLQRKESRGTLDNWLKERLAANPKSQSAVASIQSVKPLVQQQQCVPHRDYKTNSTRRRISIPQRAPAVPLMESGAIKQLLMKKTAMT